MATVRWKVHKGLVAEMRSCNWLKIPSSWQIRVCDDRVVVPATSWQDVCLGMSCYFCTSGLPGSLTWIFPCCVCTTEKVWLDRGNPHFGQFVTVRVSLRATAPLKQSTALVLLSGPTFGGVQLNQWRSNRKLCLMTNVFWLLWLFYNPNLNLVDFSFLIGCPC